jgi:hypothetical protein
MTLTQTYMKYFGRSRVNSFEKKEAIRSSFYLKPATENQQLARQNATLLVLYVVKFRAGCGGVNVNVVT